MRIIAQTPEDMGSETSTIFRWKLRITEISTISLSLSLESFIGNQRLQVHILFYILNNWTEIHHAEKIHILGRLKQCHIP